MTRCMPQHLRAGMRSGMRVHLPSIRQGGNAIRIRSIQKWECLFLRRSRKSNGKFLKTVLGGNENVINIKNYKLEKMLDEILRRTHYSSPIEYLENRIKSDYDKVRKNKKIG